MLNSDCCPRNCGAKRDYGEKGFCGTDKYIYAASASIHKGEEPPITGNRGSGTIFISGCNLRCVFCQNYQISHNRMGALITEETFADICLALQNKGAENINIVTGSHNIKAITSAIKKAKTKNMSLPVLWNSSAYETTENIILLSKYIDMFLPDLKTLSAQISKDFFNTENYPVYASEAIKKMIELKPNNVIIRHLVIPSSLESTYNVLKWFSENAKGKAILSLMTQYTPVKTKYKIPNRFVNKKEYDTVLNWLEDLGIEDGYYQELETSSDWLPDFNKVNPFPSNLSVPVWHWKHGFAVNSQ